MTTDTINHEAGDKLRGIRLQKLRVISEVLNIFEQTEKINFYAAIEYAGDVYIKDYSNPIANELYEEDKNYNPDSKFSFNSSQILNTIINFLDIWIKLGKSKNISFSFYTTNEYAKERNTAKIDSLKITLPNDPCLEIVCNDQKIKDDNLINPITKIICAAYEEAYANKKHDGNLDLILDFDFAEWRTFFSLIRWNFGMINEEELKKDILSRIRQNKYFSLLKLTDESIVFSQLMELFDSKIGETDLVNRFVYGSDILLTFHRGVNGDLMRDRLLDPVWEIWESLPIPSDKRSIKEKIDLICKDYNSRKMGLLATKVARSRIEWKEYSNDRSLISLKYRIYEHCFGELIKLVGKLPQNVNEKNIDDLIEELKVKTEECIKELSLNFNYKLSNSVFVEGIILELIDSCYLSLKYD